MKIAYIAGPYRSETHHGIELNIREAEAVAIKYWKLGYAVICPHKNTAHFDGLAEDDIWLKGDLEILRRCDVIVLMKTWQKSTGAKEEHKEAVRCGLEVIHD